MVSSAGIATFAIFVFQAVAVKSTNTAREATEGETERIIGGDNATAGQFPWAAALFYNNRFVCSSSIISPTTVLTAAHCVISYGIRLPADRFHAIANVNKSSDSVKIEFKSVTAHPRYGGSVNNDIAIFKTKDPIHFSDHVKPICIASPKTFRYEYWNATAMGWGKVNRDRIRNVIPDILQHVEQKIVPNSLCSFVNGGVNADKLCATGPFNGICNGDSGGPLVHLSADKEPVEIGIASYINAIAGCGKVVPGVWTRVSSFYDFIMKSAGESDGICVI